ncbi:uncharacterized protein At2g29880-like [Rosa chinensis]|uniref:uncharacterized protein At2g29880-like n=1 Tax=Rosa chinensis TaxID=74649 RepID=UPI000D0929D7|nr:uncharacterized protein At2g29880-like [Rosa chinensis]
MVDPQQDGKKNGNYEQWTKEESDTLLELMVDAAVRGWRDNSGILSKQIVEERILHVLNAKLGCHKTYKNYQSRVRWFKGRWNSYSTLMRFSSGFGFDSTAKRFTASNEVWEEYLKAHPKDTDLRYGTFDDYEDLEIAIGNGVAVGKNSVGLGSVTDARTLGVGEGREACIEDFDYDIDCEAFVGPNQNNPSTHPTSPLQSLEILEVPRRGTTQNKRGRTDYEGNSNSIGGTPQSGVMKKLDKLYSGFEVMINLLEKREQQSKIWDAIMEIPNLDEATGFKALELLDTKTKKD